MRPSMRASLLASLAALAAVASLAACSATGGSSFTGGTGGSSSGTSSSGNGGEGGLGIGGSIGVGGNAGGGSPGCAAATQLVYVMNTDNAIWSFDPPTKKFTFVAALDCPTAMSPNSMAIDRNLVAWLNYYETSDSGALFTFDLTTKSGCKEAVALGNGYGQVGMGFSTDTADGSAETLYLASIGGGGLAKVDMAQKKVVPIGAFNGDPNLVGQSAELTGTGDAKLFGYFTTFPEVRVAQIDKSSAKILSDQALAGFSPPSSWAFSFWGGDFYLYTADGFSSSRVVHYSPATNSVNLSYVPDTGMTIIGAGVSTCAPIVPPS
jgi:hypothetical protein